MNKETLDQGAKTLREISRVSDVNNVVYLCGKVSGLPIEEVQRKFNSKYWELCENGYEVINPVALVHPEADWQNAMKICISFLPHANYIYLLHDWQESKGATLEKELADKLGIAILTEIKPFKTL